MHNKLFLLLVIILVSSTSALADRPDQLRLNRSMLEPETGHSDFSSKSVAGLHPSAAARSHAKRKKGKLPRLSRSLRKMLGKKARQYPRYYPAATGLANNLVHPSWGQAVTAFSRMADPAYIDGRTSMAVEADMPNPRTVSNLCFAQTGYLPNSFLASDFLWQWGQFLDHDITLTPTMDPAESEVVKIPSGDRYFDPFGTGQKSMSFDRSGYQMVSGVRQQMNDITAFIDGSQVYGSDEVRQQALRTLDGTGRLKESPGGFLPFNEEGLPNAEGDPRHGAYFLAGDFRANEQVGLTSLHTLFMREHNYWATYLAHAFPSANGDRLYEMARGIVAGEIQSITYNEFLPALLGRDAIPAYKSYDPDVRPGIANEFATAAFRFGHSMLSQFIRRVEADGSESKFGDLLLRDAFFNPTRLLNEGGIEPVLRGLAAQRAQEIDGFLVDDVRNFLFGPPGSGGFDLATLNIQRGRDHGMPRYNEMRRALGLPPVSDFSQISSNPSRVACLRAAYGDVEHIELWVGGLNEDPTGSAMVGETFFHILQDQFIRLRDGDRFWYQRYLPDRLLRMVRKQTLAKIIRRNTSIGSELQDDVFHIKTE